MFYSQIFTLKLNLRAKFGLTYSISIVRWIIRTLSKKIFFFLLFFAEFELLMFHNNIVKSSVKKGERVELIENPSYVPYRFLYNLHSFFYGKKMKIFDF